MDISNKIKEIDNLRTNDNFIIKETEINPNHTYSIFEINELKRDYFNKLDIYNKTFYLEYNDIKHHYFYNECFIIVNIDDKYTYNLKDYYDSLNLAFKNKYNEFINNLKINNLDLNNLYATCYKKNLNIKDEIYNPKERIKESIKNEYSALALVLAKQNDEYYVLTIKNIINNYSFPKGHVEYCETNLEAAIRECMEETNIKIKPKQLVKELETYNYKFQAASIRMANEEFYLKNNATIINKTIYPFLFIIDKMDEGKPQIEENIIKVEWINIKEVINYLTFDNDIKNLNEVMKYLKINL